MKKAKLLMMSAVVLGGIQLLGAERVSADVAEGGTSANKVAFEGGDTDPTDPVDPTDPENPNPIDPIDPENPGTGNPGPLSIDFISNLDFGIQKISTDTQQYSVLNENPFVQVTDVTGSGDGWSLTAQATEFKNKDQSKVLKGAELAFRNGKTNAKASNVSTPPDANQNLRFTNQDAQEVMSAGVGAGKGTWVDVWSGAAGANESIQLKVLAGSADATAYTSTITWTLTSGPVTAP